MSRSYDAYLTGARRETRQIRVACPNRDCPEFDVAVLVPTFSGWEFDAPECTTCISAMEVKGVSK